MDPDVIDTIGVGGIDAIAAHFGGVWPKLAPTATAASAASGPVAASAVRPRASAAAASAPSAAQLPRKRSPPAISGAPRGPRDSRTAFLSWDGRFAPSALSPCVCALVLGVLSRGCCMGDQATSKLYTRILAMPSLTERSACLRM